MATIKQFKKRVQNLNAGAVAQKSLTATADQLLELNSQQMLDGKRRDGQDISPTYLEDPFFKSKKQAQAYSDWKDRITPSSVRKKGVPNLYINGTYHGSIEVDVSGEALLFSSSFPGASDIDRTFPLIHGLNSEYRTIYVTDSLRPKFMELMKKVLKL